MSDLYFYHSDSNTVTEYNTPVSYDQFVSEEIGDNSYWSGPRTDGKIEVYASGGEFLLLDADKQTVEQAVILFATLRGLRDTAED